MRDLWEFVCCLSRYFKSKARQFFHFLEKIKSWLAAWLYQQRGRYAQSFIRLGMVFLVVSGLSLGPVLISERFRQPWQGEAIASSELSVLSLDLHKVF